MAVSKTMLQPGVILHEVIVGAFRAKGPVSTSGVARPKMLDKVYKIPSTTSHPSSQAKNAPNTTPTAETYTGMTTPRAIVGTTIGPETHASIRWLTYSGTWNTLITLSMSRQQKHTLTFKRISTTF